MQYRTLRSTAVTATGLIGRATVAIVRRSHLLPGKGKVAMRLLVLRLKLQHALQCDSITLASFKMSMPQSLTIGLIGTKQ